MGNDSILSVFILSPELQCLGPSLALGQLGIFHVPAGRWKAPLGPWDFSDMRGFQSGSTCQVVSKPMSSPSAGG